MLRSETFYAPASWLSTTKILSITEKRALLNSTGIDIHSEACYVKVTAAPRRGEDASRLQAARVGEAAEKWHEGKLGKKNWSARGMPSLPDWEGQPIRNLRSIKLEREVRTRLSFIDARLSSSLAALCPSFF